MPYLNQATSSLPLYKEYAWDFDKNDFVVADDHFVILSGLEAIKVWLYKAVNVERYKYPAFHWQYGVEIEALIGQVEVTKKILEKQLSEALCVNPYINKVSIDQFRKEGAKVTFTALIETAYGEVTIYA